MIYTSRFQNPTLKSGEYTVVGIVRGLPRFRLGYNLSGNIIDIAPTKALFTVCDREEFTPPYMKHLDEVGFERIAAQIQKYAEHGKDVVLCCYEDVRIPGEWCHRLVFAEWWKLKTGETLTELQDDSALKTKSKVLPTTPQKNKAPLVTPGTDKPLLKVVYSLWTNIVDGELIYLGEDRYFEVDRAARKVMRRVANADARDLISQGRADVWIDYDSIAKIRFVLTEDSSGKAYIAYKEQKEKEIAFKDALRLIKNGKANIKDIEIEYSPQ